MLILRMMKKAPWSKPINSFMLARLISLIGDSMGQLALTWWIASGAHKSELGLLMGASSLSLCAALLFSGPLVELTGKVSAMLLGEAACASTTLLLLILVSTDGWSLPALLALVCIKGVGQAIFFTASQSFIPAICSKDQLPSAYAKASIIVGVAAALGGAVGGGLLATGGVPFSILVDLGSYLLSMAIIWSIRTPHTRPATTPSFSIFKQLLEGYSYLQLHPQTRKTLFLVGSLCFVTAGLPVALPLLVATTYKLSAAYLGALEFAFAAGGIVGGTLLKIKAKRWVVPNVGLPVMSCSFALIIMGFLDSPYISISLYFIYGLSMSVANVAMSTDLWAGVSEQYAPRIAAFLMIATRLLTPFGIYATTPLLISFGPGATIALMGLALPLPLILVAYSPKFTQHNTN